MDLSFPSTRSSVSAEFDQTLKSLLDISSSQSSSHFNNQSIKRECKIELQPADCIEIIGRSGIGMTECLIDCLIQAILPPSITRAINQASNQTNKLPISQLINSMTQKVFLIDCDQRLQILRIQSIIQTRLHSIYQSINQSSSQQNNQFSQSSQSNNQSIDQSEIDLIVRSCLDRITVLSPSSPVELIASIRLIDRIMEQSTDQINQTNDQSINQLSGMCHPHTLRPNFHQSIGPSNARPPLVHASVLKEMPANVTNNQSNNQSNSQPNSQVDDQLRALNQRSASRSPAPANGQSNNQSNNQSNSPISSQISSQTNSQGSYHSNNQSINQSNNQKINQPKYSLILIDHASAFFYLSKQMNNQSNNQSIDPSINQSINQTIDLYTSCARLIQPINQKYGLSMICTKPYISRPSTDQSINQSINREFMPAEWSKLIKYRLSLKPSINQSIHQSINQRREAKLIRLTPAVKQPNYPSNNQSINPFSDTFHYVIGESGLQVID